MRLKCPWLQVTDENSGITLFRESGKYTEPLLLTTYSSHVRLRFNSDAANNGNGFIIAYYSKNPYSVCM